MKLFYSITSPYSRKARLMVLEKGLSDQVTEVLVDPFGDASDLKAANPLGKIPTLVLNNGEVLFDSPVICRYIDQLETGRTLIPTHGDKQWIVLRWEALCDGMMDAAYNIAIERRRPDNEQSDKWILHWSEDIKRVLIEMERRFTELDGEIMLSHIALAAALSYLELRVSEVLNEVGSSCCPQVLSWYSVFKERPSMQATA